MKTTLEISDHLLRRAKALARRRGTTLRGLAEEGLRRVLDEAEAATRTAVRPVVVRGDGLAPEFQDASWKQVRDAAYGAS